MVNVNVLELKKKITSGVVAARIRCRNAVQLATFVCRSSAAAATAASAAGDDEVTRRGPAAAREPRRPHIAVSFRQVVRYSYCAVTDAAA